MRLITNILEVSLKITERGNQSIKIVLGILLICVTTIALSKFYNSDLFRNVTKSFFRFKLLDNNFNDETRISLWTSILLNLNFIISLTICFFLACTNFVSGNSALFYALLLSTYFIVVQQISFRLATYLSGENMISDAMGNLTKQIWQMLGLLLLIVSLVWSLNQQLSSNFTLLYAFILFFLIVFRYIKGVFLCYKLGIKWYYLILYLCTLEIMPTLLLYYLIIKDLAYL
jgi:hypothetical protein